MHDPRSSPRLLRMLIGTAVAVLVIRCAPRQDGAEALSEAAAPARAAALPEPTPGVAGPFAGWPALDPASPLAAFRAGTYAGTDLDTALAAGDAWWLDAAAAHRQGTQALILRRNAATSLRPGADTRRIHWVDLDADGDQDLFGLNYESSNEIWLAGADGALEPASIPGNHLEVASKAKGSAFADVDGDGDLDAYIANGGDQPNRVLANESAQGSPARFAAWPVTADADARHSYAARFGDLDGDGLLDLAVANSRAPSDLYVQRRDGARIDFQPAAGGDFSATVLDSRDLDLADLDLDGDLDLVVANMDDQPAGAFVNEGGQQGGAPGRFVGLAGDPLTRTPGRAAGIHARDLNGDGLPEVVAANRGLATALFRNRTAPGAAAPAFELVTGSILDGDVAESFDARLADLDADGDVDLVLANRGAPCAIYLATGVDPFLDPARSWERLAGGPLASHVGSTLSIAIADAPPGVPPRLALGNTAGEVNLVLENLGAAFRGAAPAQGQPRLAGLGSTRPGEVALLLVTDALPGAGVGLLLTADDSAPAPAASGIAATTRADAQGRALFTLTIPAAAAVGAGIAAQAVLEAASGPALQIRVMAPAEP